MQKAKRILSLALVLMLTLAAIPFQAAMAADADDLVGHKYESVMRKWIDKGWMAGTGVPGEYAPDRKITRAEFAVFFNHFEGYTAQSPDIAKYTDVPQWALVHMARALQAGYFIGSGNTMMPSGPISQDMALTSVGSSTKYYDRSKADASVLTKLSNGASVADWAIPSVAAALSANFALVADGALIALDQLTRAQTVFLLDCLMTDTHTYGIPDTVVSGNHGGAVLAADGVTLKDSVIAGDVYVDEAVADGDVYLENVQIGGILRVQGGGLESVHIKSSKVAAVVVTKDEVRVVYENGTEVAESRVNGESSIIVVENGAKIDSVVVEAEAVGAQVVVSSGATVAAVEVAAPISTVTLESGATVTALTIADTAADALVETANGSKITNLVVEAAAEVTGTGAITNATVTADDVVIAQTPTGTVKVEGDVTANVGGKDVAGTDVSATPAPTAAPTQAPSTPSNPDPTPATTAPPTATPVPPDATAPVLSDGTVARTSDTAATIGFTTDEAGTAYYTVVDKDATPPTNTAVAEGTEIGAVTATAVTGKAVTLTAGAKDIYVVVKDAAGNISTALKIAAAAYVPGTTDPEVTGFTFTATDGLKQGNANAAINAVAGTFSAPVGGTSP
ncbi:MAG: S-layer homology domain-containing protein, partial [Oscillospiraceae bacterium]|nr:S-layer homology domain-containing protein [Oscillospiraceae bacterium]